MKTEQAIVDDLDRILLRSIITYQAQHYRRPTVILMHPQLFEKLKDWVELATNIKLPPGYRAHFLGIPIYRSEDLAADEFGLP